MKKTINIILVLILTLILSSCFTSQDDVNKAKQNLWIIESNNIDSWNNLDDEIEKAKNEIIQDSRVEEVEEVEEEQKTIIINTLTTEQFLEFDDLSRENFLDWEIEIKWKTLWNVDKIVVTFANNGSEFPVDVYTLKQFTSWDNEFLYRAFSRYETLDFWENTYIFEAHSWDKISKLQLTLNVVKEEDKKISQKVEEVFEDISLNNLPIKASFWTPVDLWGGKISYTDLKWLEIKKDINSDLTCDSLTNILIAKFGVIYWNTCRPIETDEGISFFVIRLDGDNYVYEKHYYLSYEWLYWIQELEIGTWVDSTNIWEKNTELKEENEDYAILEVTDDLFVEILK